MGYMVHHGMFVTSFNKDKAIVAHKEAQEIFGDLVSELRESAINGYWSFAVFPDGSKEGWTDSEEGDARRARFIAWLETQRYEDKSSPFDWVEVQYGDDDNETRIVNDSDAWKRSGDVEVVEEVQAT